MDRYCRSAQSSLLCRPTDTSSSAFSTAHMAAIRVMTTNGSAPGSARLRQACQPRPNAMGATATSSRRLDVSWRLTFVPHGLCRQRWRGTEGSSAVCRGLGGDISVQDWFRKVVPTYCHGVTQHWSSPSQAVAPGQFSGCWAQRDPDTHTVATVRAAFGATERRARYLTVRQFPLSPSQPSFL